MKFVLYFLIAMYITGMFIGIFYVEFKKIIKLPIPLTQKIIWSIYRLFLFFVVIAIQITFVYLIFKVVSKLIGLLP